MSLSMFVWLPLLLGATTDARPDQSTQAAPPVEWWPIDRSVAEQLLTEDIGAVIKSLVRRACALRARQGTEADLLYALAAEVKAQPIDLAPALQYLKARDDPASWMPKVALLLLGK